MTPREIVERVRERNQKRQIIVDHYPDDIDHLLAIHAAAVEMLEAENAARKAETESAYFDAMERRRQSRTNLADLCGWKAEGA